MNENTLNEYFSKVRNGDKEAFAQIYNEYKKPVFTIAFRMVQSRELAEDVTQDIFVKLFISPPDPSIHNLRAWIFQMTRNLAIDALRKKECTDIDDVVIATEDEINNAIMRMDIESAIRRLPSDEREIISLHLTADLGFHSIARMIGLSMPATYRKYRKAIKALREQLDGGAI